MSAKSNLLRRLSALYVARDKAGATATSCATAKAAGTSSFDVVSATGLAVGQSLRLDDGENVERAEIETLVGTTVGLVKPTLVAHAAGFAVIPQTVYDVGDVKGQVGSTGTVAQTDVLSAMRRLKFQILQGYQTEPLETSIYGVTPENLAVVLGIPYTTVQGTGADIDHPKVLATDFNDIDSESNVCVILKYVTQSGTIRVREWWGCAVDYAGYSIQFAIGQDGAIPLKLTCYGAMVEGDYTPTFTADTSKKAGKGKVFDKLSSVGIWAAGGGDTTVATDAAAGATSFDVASAAGLAAGEWIAIGADDTLELAYVPTGGIAVNTITPAWPLLLAHSAGAAVQIVTESTFAAIGKDGAKLNLTGTTTPIESGLRRLPLGMQAGTVDADLQMSLVEMSSAAFAYSRGIPQGNIANNRVLLTEELATATILGVFAKGVLKDGTVCYINIMGSSQDVASVATQFGSDPNAATVPFNTKASSGIQLVQYAA